MDTEAPTKIVIRDPAEVQRAYAQERRDQQNEARQNLERDALNIAIQLVNKAEHNQKVIDTHQFTARISLKKYGRYQVDLLLASIESYLKELIEDDGHTDLLVKIFDDRSDYGGGSEICDITLWAVPRT